MCFGGNGDAGGGGVGNIGYSAPAAGGYAGPGGSAGLTAFGGPAGAEGYAGPGGAMGLGQGMSYGGLGDIEGYGLGMGAPSFSGAGAAAGGAAGAGAAAGLGELSMPGDGFLGFLSKLAPIAGAVASLFTANPAPYAIGTGVGKALSSISKGQAVDEAIGKGALTVIGTAVNPGLGYLASFLSDQPGTGQAQASDLAAPEMFGSVTGGEGMAVPGQQPGQPGMPTMMGPEPIASLPTGPISASNLTVPPTKANPLNLSNLLASRGIRGAGRIAPKKEWFERRT